MNLLKAFKLSLQERRPGALAQWLASWAPNLWNHVHFLVLPCYTVVSFRPQVPFTSLLSSLPAYNYKALPRQKLTLNYLIHPLQERSLCKHWFHCHIKLSYSKLFSAFFGIVLLCDHHILLFLVVTKVLHKLLTSYHCNSTACFYFNSF